MPEWGQASFESVDVASASSLDLSAVTTAKVRVTGTVNINTITMKPFQFLFITFVGALTILSTAASLPNGGANIATEAGDRMVIMADGAGFGTVWDYQRASGTALQAGISGLTLTGGTLAITVDTNRTLAINGNTTLNDWFNQSVKSTAAPTFAGITVNGTIVLGQGGDDAIAINGSQINVSGPVIITATDTNGLVVGRNTSFPAFWVDTGGTVSYTVGLKVLSNTPGSGGITLSTNAASGNEGMTIQALNAGTLALGGSTNTVAINRPFNITNVTTINHTALPLTITNTQNAVSAPVLRLEGDRASSATGDVAYVSFFLSHESAGTQFEFCRISWEATAAADDDTEVGSFIFQMANAGVLGTRYIMRPTSFSSVVNGVSSLGEAGRQFHHLYLSNTSTINFNNGNVILAHSSGFLGITSESTFHVGANANQQVTLYKNGMTIRRDQAGINDSLYFTNLGIAAASQGATVRYQFQGAAGVATVAAEMATLSTEDWNGDANKSAKYRFNTITNNVLNVSLDILEFGIHVAPSKALVAGGDVTEYIKLGTSSQGIYVGSGAPNKVAAQGSIYMRSDGSSSSTRLYVNTDGGSTWVNVTTAS